MKFNSSLIAILKKILPSLNSIFVLKNVDPTHNPLVDTSLPHKPEEVREMAHKLLSLNHVNHKTSHRSVITLSEGYVPLTWHMRIAHIAFRSGTAQLEHVQSQRNIAWSYGDLFLNSTTFLHYQAVVQTLHALCSHMTYFLFIKNCKRKRKSQIFVYSPSCHCRHVSPFLLWKTNGKSYWSFVFHALTWRGRGRGFKIKKGQVVDFVQC